MHMSGKSFLSSLSTEGRAQDLCLNRGRKGSTTELHPQHIFYIFLSMQALIKWPTQALNSKSSGLGLLSSFHYRPVPPSMALTMANPTVVVLKPGFLCGALALLKLAQ